MTTVSKTMKSYLYLYILTNYQFVLYFSYMNNVVNISDFRNNISDYINRIIYKNESFLIKRGASVVVKVIAYKNDRKAIKDKIKKFAGIWSEKDATTIKEYAKKMRKEAKFIRT